jgi:hypothetical protein
MKTATIEIVDRGRGPQLSTTRITVLDIFYYLHRGYDFDFIHQAMPSLTREEFDVVNDYVKAHYDELVEKDRKADEFHQRGMDAQHAKGGLFAPTDENLTTAERVARLKEKLTAKAEKNGAGHPDRQEH